MVITKEKIDRVVVDLRNGATICKISQRVGLRYRVIGEIDSCFNKERPLEEYELYNVKDLSGDELLILLKCGKE